MEELRYDRKHLSQPMKSAISGHEKSCRPQGCLILNSFSHNRQQEPITHFLFLPCSHTIIHKHQEKGEGMERHNLITKEGRFQVTVDTHRSGKIRDCTVWFNKTWFVGAGELEMVTPSCLQEKGGQQLCAQCRLKSWASESQEEITRVGQEVSQRWWKEEWDAHPFKTQGKNIISGIMLRHQETKGKQWIKEYGQSRTVCSQSNSIFLASFCFWAEALGAFIKI